MDSTMSFLKKHLAKLRSVGNLDIAFHNVLVNAIAVMLIYSAHFGSCAVAVSIVSAKFMKRSRTISLSLDSVPRNLQVVSDLLLVDPCHMMKKISDSFPLILTSIITCQDILYFPLFNFNCFFFISNIVNLYEKFLIERPG